MVISANIKNIFSLYSTTILSIVVGVGVSILNTRLLGAEAFGDFKFIQNISVKCKSKNAWRDIWVVKKEIKEAYVSAIGIEGNKQLSRMQKSMMPYRSRVIQPGIFIKEKLICAPTIDSEFANYLSFCGIKFIDFLMSH